MSIDDAQLELAIEAAPDYEPERGDPTEPVADLVLGWRGQNGEQRRLLLLLQEQYDLTLRRSNDACAMYHIHAPYEADESAVYLADGGDGACRECGAVIGSGYLCDDCDQLEIEREGDVT